MSDIEELFVTIALNHLKEVYGEDSFEIDEDYPSTHRIRIYSKNYPKLYLAMGVIEEINFFSLHNVKKAESLENKLLLLGFAKWIPSYSLR